MVTLEVIQPTLNLNELLQTGNLFQTKRVTISSKLYNVLCNRAAIVETTEQ